MKLPAAFLLLLAAAVTLAYFPSLTGEFIWDDRSQVLLDDYIHTPAHVANVLTLRVLAQDVVDANRPVQLLSLMLDSLLWDRDPFGYRLTNLLLHLANTLLLFLLITRLLHATAKRSEAGPPATLNPPHSSLPPRPSPLDTRHSTLAAAGAAALLFALHPLAAEPVSSPGFREDLLVTLFTLLALLAATAFAGRRWKYGAASLLCVFLAVASKETGIAAPIALAAYWLVFQKWRGLQSPKTKVARNSIPRESDHPNPTNPPNPARNWILLLAGAALIALAFLGARFLLNTHDTSPHFGQPVRPGSTLTEIAALQLRFWALDLKLLLWPSGLSAVYGPNSLRHLPLALAIPAIAITIAAGLLWIRRDRRVLLGATLAVAALLPVSNLVPMYFHIADRFLYLPLAGLALCLAAGLESLFRKTFRPRYANRSAATLAALGLALLALGLTAHHRARVWSHRVSLWEDTVQKNPQSAASHNALAAARDDNGNLPAAVDAWRQAVLLSGERSANYLASLALGLETLGQSREAEEFLRKAVALDPSFADPETLTRHRAWPPENAARLRAILLRL